MRFPFLGLFLSTSIASLTLLLVPVMAVAEKPVVPVTVENFARAETAAQFDRILAMSGGINTWYHFRQPTPLDKQPVIRMNRDTLYSAAIVDISDGATLIIPDTGDRYLSVMVVNEDHYINRVFHEPGSHELTVDEFDTPYVDLSARILVDASDPADIQAANALQDQLKIEAESARPYTHPAYDEASYKPVYDALLLLGRGVPDARNTFGKKEDVNPVRHLLATAWGWGGLPDEEVQYLNVDPDLPVGAYSLTVKDVPVDAFWSISVYNKDGYFQENEYDAYSVNSVTAMPNPDGSYTVHLGGDPDSINFLPITEGWNYAVRMYQPREVILEGSWTFPEFKVED